MLIRNLLIMLAVVIGGFTALLFTLPTPEAIDEKAERSAVVIENVRYFDGDGIVGPTRLVVEEGRIASIGASSPLPDDVMYIDGDGLTALPGLIDAHVHSYGSSQRDAVRFGVTTVIDMFTDPANLIGAREARESYEATSDAALFSAGMLATVDGGHGTQFPVQVDTLQGPAQATTWVAARLAEGSDFIKLVYMPEWQGHPSLDLATASAVIDAAHDAGVQAVAHIASQASARELLDAGIDGFVHVFADTTVDDDFLRAARERKVFVIPTLAIIATAAGRSTGPGLLEHPLLADRLSPLAQAGLRQQFGQVSEIFNLEIALDNVRRLHQAGVPILAGSDAPNPGTAHGATLHAELELLVRAGLSAAEALAAATTVPAKHFQLDGRGRIAAGARADLLLVQGDPLTDIEVTRSIHTILRNGRVMEDDGDTTPSATAVALPASLSDFDDGLTAPQGLSWSATSDAMMGGSSEAELNVVARDGGGALRVSAAVTNAFAYPWAGAYLGFTEPQTHANLSDVQAIRFHVRGTPARYRLMLFEQGSFGTPPAVEFEVGEQWRAVEIDLAEVTAFERSRFTGMAFVSPMAGGEYAFALDEVQLVRR